MGLLTSDGQGSFPSLITQFTRSTETRPLPRAHRGVRGALVPGLVTESRAGGLESPRLPLLLLLTYLLLQLHRGPRVPPRARALIELRIQLCFPRRDLAVRDAVQRANVSRHTRGRLVVVS